MSDLIRDTTATARRAEKAARPSHWVATVELPGGLVAWAHYEGSEVWGHGIETGKTIDEVTCAVLRRIPVPAEF